MNNRSLGVLATICALSLQVTDVLAGDTDSEARPVFVKVLTSDNEVIFGRLGREADGEIEILGFEPGQTITVAKKSIQQIRKGIPESDIVNGVGLKRYLAWKIDDILPKTRSGKIIKVDINSVYVSLGKESGVKDGSELRVYRGNSELKDPATGKVLGVERRLTARLKVTETNEEFVKARLVGDLETELREGDVVELPAPSVTIVVLPFIDASGKETSLGRDLSEGTVTALVNRKLSVIERDQLLNVLAELDFQQTSFFDPTSTQKIGKLTGAYAMVLGSMKSVPGNSTVVNIRLVEVESAKILFALTQRLQGRPIGEEIPNSSTKLPPSGPSHPIQITNESIWINESYKTTLRHIKGKEWVDFEDKTGKVWLRYQETSRTNEYLELLCPERNHLMRIYAKRADLKKDGKWEWVSNGYWVHPSK